MKIDIEKRTLNITQWPIVRNMEDLKNEKDYFND